MKEPIIPLLSRVCLRVLEWQSERFCNKKRGFKKNDSEAERLMKFSYNSVLADEAWDKKDYKRVVTLLKGCEQYFVENPILEKKYSISKRKK